MSLSLQIGMLDFLPPPVTIKRTTYTPYLFDPVESFRPATKRLDNIQT
jgi:hypothetical protein